MRALATILRFFRRDDGNATIEFCFLFPLFMGIFGSAFEAAFVTMRQVMLERATEIVVRNVRLGIGGTPTHESLKADICNVAGVIPDCMNTLHIELERVGADWAMRTGAVQCVDLDQDIEPAVSFTQGTDNELMLMTVCAAIRPLVPTTGLGLKLSEIYGGQYYALVAMTAFANEPNS